MQPESLQKCSLSTPSFFSSPSLPFVPTSPQRPLESSRQLAARQDKLYLLLATFKKNAISEKQFVEKLRSELVVVRDSREYRDTHLPKELDSFNQIKENNQRILKTKIKSLELKIAELLKSPVSDNQIIQDLTKKLQEKESLLQRASTIQNKLQSTVQHYQKQNQRLVEELSHLKQHPPVAPIPVPSLSPHSAVFLLSIMPTSHSELAELRDRCEVLMGSNSALRNELIHLHEFMDQQDTTYAGTVAKLEERITSLTRYQLSKANKLKRTISSSNYRDHVVSHQDQIDNYSNQLGGVEDVDTRFEPKILRDSKMTISSVTGHND